MKSPEILLLSCVLYKILGIEIARKFMARWLQANVDVATAPDGALLLGMFLRPNRFL